jgi:hypothetical protein
MPSLTSIVEISTRALAGVTPHTLTAKQLNSSLQALKEVDIHEAIDEYWTDLPSKPEVESEIIAWKKLMHDKGKELSHQVNVLNHELSRIKEMHAALGLEQLDDLIHLAQKIIRPLYNFTSQLTY